MQGNVLDISFHMEFLRKSQEKQEFRRNSLALLLHNTVLFAVDQEVKGVLAKTFLV